VERYLVFVWARKNKTFNMGRKYVARTVVWVVGICEIGNKLSGFGFLKGTEY